jgi:hypothetical protein
VKELIYNQNDIPPEKWRYGFRSSADTGCGWIATYNALRLMGYYAKPEALIRSYQRMLPLIHGNTGTNALAPALMLRAMGFGVKVICRREEYDRAVKESDVCILFYHWKRKWKLGGHFVAVEHREGGFVGYNTYKNSRGPDRYGESLDGWLRQRKYFATVLICVKDKR